MIHLHEEFVLAAYIVFGAALLWDFLAPQLSYKKTLRDIRLRTKRNKTIS